MLKLLKEGTDPNARNESSVIALHLAVWYGRLAVAQALVGAPGEDAKTNAGSDSRTALHYAAREGQLAVAQFR